MFVPFIYSIVQVYRAKFITDLSAQWTCSYLLQLRIWSINSFLLSKKWPGTNVSKEKIIRYPPSRGEKSMLWQSYRTHYYKMAYYKAWMGF